MITMKFPRINTIWSQNLIKQSLENQFSNNSNKEIVYTVCNHTNPVNTTVNAKICRSQLCCDSSDLTVNHSKINFLCGVNANAISLQNMNSNISEYFCPKCDSEQKVLPSVDEPLLYRNLDLKPLDKQQYSNGSVSSRTNTKSYNKDLSNSSRKNQIRFTDKEPKRDPTTDVERLNYHNRPKNKAVRIPEKPRMEDILDSIYNKYEPKEEPALEDVLRKYKQSVKDNNKGSATGKKPNAITFKKGEILDDNSSIKPHLNVPSRTTNTMGNAYSNRLNDPSRTTNTMGNAYSNRLNDPSRTTNAVGASDSNHAIRLPSAFLNSKDSMLNVTLKNESSEPVYIILESNEDFDVNRSEVKPGETFNRLEKVTIADLKNFRSLNGKLIDFFLRNETKEDIGVELDTHENADVQLLPLR